MYVSTLQATFIQVQLRSDKINTTIINGKSGMNKIVKASKVSPHETVDGRLAFATNCWHMPPGPPPLRDELWMPNAP